ncbi:MAG: hypothetical protein V2J55_01385 [Candidatus Competibacteraceae bacterium]|jgi:hypothetical protein|nr:hypothetical protein [Candidatus Competibacteraceae bacterium]
MLFDRGHSHPARTFDTAPCVHGWYVDGRFNPPDAACSFAGGVPDITGERATWAILYAGLVPTGLAFLLRAVLIQSAGPVFMSLVAYNVPIWAVLLGHPAE